MQIHIYAWTCVSVHSSTYVEIHLYMDTETDLSACSECNNANNGQNNSVQQSNNFALNRHRHLSATGSRLACEIESTLGNDPPKRDLGRA